MKKEIHITIPNKTFLMKIKNEAIEKIKQNPSMVKEQIKLFKFYCKLSEKNKDYFVKITDKETKQKLGWTNTFLRLNECKLQLSRIGIISIHSGGVLLDVINNAACEAKAKRIPVKPVKS